MEVLTQLLERTDELLCLLDCCAYAQCKDNYLHRHHDEQLSGLLNNSCSSITD